jgi:hypothetical protein
MAFSSNCSAKIGTLSLGRASIFLFIYGIFNDAISSTHYIDWDDRMTRCGRKRRLSNFRQYPSTCFETTIRRVSHRPQTQTPDQPYRKQQWYLLDCRVRPLQEGRLHHFIEPRFFFFFSKFFLRCLNKFPSRFDKVTGPAKQLSSLTNSAELSPSSEANSRSATQQISSSLRNPKIHYRVHKSAPLVLILSQIHIVRTVICNFLKSLLNSILPSMPRSMQCSLSSRFSHHDFVCSSRLSHTC